MKRIETRTLKKRLASIIEEKLQDINLELHDIEYRKENDAQVLRIFVDKESGVDLDACSQATRVIKNLIEENDIIYDLLEVSSPGLDRALTKERDFVRCKGSKIKIKTLQLFSGARKFTGILHNFDESEIVIEKDQQLIAIPREIVSIVRLDPDE
ncbi:MAG: ribosome maturation factor RimP [Syntrophomonadaceae bacterium]|nr:ribosome maturation factor RimP [Syntrophomonadaceae bacterium]